jgi:transposase
MDFGMDVADLIELQDSKVIDVSLDKHDIIITIETTEASVACHICGKQLTKRHGSDQDRKLRHLPILGKRTYIIYKPHRYICNDCDNNPTTTATPRWHNRDSQYTIDYENHILMELINSTILDVATKEELTEASVTGIVDRHIKSSVDWESFTILDVLGIDEIALKKGYKDYVTIITSRHDGVIRLLAVLRGKEKTIIKAFFKSIPRRLKKTVTAICTDMYDGYINAAKSVFKKQTIIVVDRFHIAKQYRGELDKYRQKILKQLKDELPHHEYEKLKGAMHILRRNNECLTKREKVILDNLFSHSPELAQAYKLAIKLTQILNTYMIREEALIKINAWIKEVKQSQLTCFNKFIKTLNKYKQYVINYFIDRNSSGFVEGLNNKVKVLKRRCYGIFNLKHFFQRLHLDISGYSILLGNSSC